MDSFKDNEVTDKLKKAIRAKLADMAIDAHDDKLTDFIMVMAMNGKTKQLMTSELGVFLQDKTNAFTDWLFEILLKIQFASIPERVKQKRKEKSAKQKKDQADADSKESKKPGVHTEVIQMAPIIGLMPVAIELNPQLANVDARPKKTKKDSKGKIEDSKPGDKSSSTRKRKSDHSEDITTGKRKPSDKNREVVHKGGSISHSKHKTQEVDDRKHKKSTSNSKPKIPSEDHTKCKSQLESRDKAKTESVGRADHNTASTHHGKHKTEPIVSDAETLRHKTGSSRPIEKYKVDSTGSKLESNVDKKMDECIEGQKTSTAAKTTSSIDNQNANTIKRIISHGSRNEGATAKNNASPLTADEPKKVEVPFEIAAGHGAQDDLDKELLGKNEARREDDTTRVSGRKSQLASGERKVEMVHKTKVTATKGNSSAAVAPDSDEYRPAVHAKPEAVVAKTEIAHSVEKIDTESAKSKSLVERKENEKESKGIRIVRLKPRRADSDQNKNNTMAVKPIPQKDDATASKPASVVGSVIERDVRDEDDEKYDPYKPVIGKVASTVNVSRSRPNLPKGLQPSRNMVFKAVLEAASSVSKTPNLPGNIRCQLVDSKMSVEKLLQKKKLREAASIVATMKHGEESREIKNARECLDHDATQTSVNVEELLDMDYEFKNQEVEVAEESGVDETSLAYPEEMSPPEEVVEPKFIISIDDSYEKTIAKQIAHRGNLRNGKEMADPSYEDSFEVSETELAELDEDLVKKDKVDLELKEKSSPPVPVVVAETNEEATVKKESPARESPEKTKEIQPELQPMAVVPPMTINVGEDSDDSTDDIIKHVPSKHYAAPSINTYDEGLALEEPVVSPGSNEMCRYWPNCDRGESCLYKHPETRPATIKPTIVMCKYLPNCPFGAECRFVHPQCKFGDYCTNKYCIYSHENGSKTAKFVSSTKLAHQTILPPKAPPVSATTCRYQPYCTNPRCPYKHPKIAMGAALKWTKQSGF